MPFNCLLYVLTMTSETVLLGAHIFIKYIFLLSLNKKKKSPKTLCLQSPTYSADDTQTVSAEPLSTKIRLIGVRNMVHQQKIKLKLM